MVLALCTLSDNALYLYIIWPKYLKSFRDTNQDSSVDSRWVANVDGRAYGKPHPYIAPCLRQARLNVKM